MHQPPFRLRQAASNARRISGPAFSRSAAEAIRTSCAQAAYISLMGAM